MNNSQYLIKSEHFEGPLDLLLSLIEKRKLFINDISLSKVTDDYIVYIKTLERLPIAETAHFILIGSTLLLIKSRSLLPSLSLSGEEEVLISDLEERLQIYKRMKDLSVHIKEKFGKNLIFMPESRKIEPVFLPSKDCVLLNLVFAMKETIKNLPKKEFIQKAVVKKIVSLEEVIENLTERIKSAFKMNFKDFAGIGKSDKINIIVSFLALLELVKRGDIKVSQDEGKGDIFIENSNVAVPRYTSQCS